MVKMGERGDNGGQDGRGGANGSQDGRGMG